MLFNTPWIADPLNMSWVADPLRRRQALTAASGALILAALAAGQLAGLPALGAGLMVAAALLAGSDIAVRAWSALRGRHVGIELLVTIAAVGAIAIGEFWEAVAVTFLFLLGAYLETRTLQKTRRALQDLLEQAPLTAIVLRPAAYRAVCRGIKQFGAASWLVIWWHQPTR